MNVHLFLEEERARLRKTQEEMAELGGVKLRTYANYAAGDRVPDASFLQAIAAAGADVQYILTGVHGTPAMTAEQERAGYVVQVLSPAEAAALEALRQSDALRSAPYAVAAGEQDTKAMGLSSGPQPLEPRRKKAPGEDKGHA